MAEVATFRVYPGFGNREHDTGTRGLYFVVRVYDTLGEMRKCCTEDGSSGKGFFDSAYGACQKWRISSHPGKRGRKSVRTKESGQIMLYRKQLGVAIVTHECVHAALFWYARITGSYNKGEVKIAHNQSDEEMLAYGVGEMARQVYLGLEKQGVLKLSRG